MSDIQWQENVELIEDLLWQEKALHNLASIGGCIVNDTHTTWSAYSGHARREDQYLAEPSSIYRLGSISKVFIAHMLMQLRDAGAIDLNQPVQHVLPTFDRLDTDTPVTFHHLITHTSGLPLMPPIADMMETLTFPDIVQLLDSLNETELLFRPGSGFSYSNFGAALLAHALESVAGLSCADYIETRILQPLGMNHSGYSLAETAKPLEASGYIAVGGDLRSAPMIDIGAFAPIGNIASSAEDMEKFIRFQFAGEGADSPVLSSSTLQEMQTIIRLDSDHREVTAIGWRPSSINNTPVLAHGGADMAFVSYLAVVPSRKLGLFLTTNTGVDPERIANIARDVLELILS